MLHLRVSGLQARWPANWFKDWYVPAVTFQQFLIPPRQQSQVQPAHLAATPAHTRFSAREVHLCATPWLLRRSTVTVSATLLLVCCRCTARQRRLRRRAALPAGPS